VGITALIAPGAQSFGRFALEAAIPSRPPVHRPQHYNPAATREAQLRALDQRRGSAASRGYDGAWNRVRLQALNDEPLCRHSRKAGLITAAVEVHHSIKLRDRPDLRLDRSVLVPLCKSCHSKETAQGR